MKAEKIVAVLEMYRGVLEAKGVKKVDYPHDKKLTSKKKGLEHCHGMIDKAINHAQTGHIEKADRWLGFIQKGLWVNGFYTLDELMNHNRPTEPE